MKKAAILGLTTIISVVLTISSSKVDSAPKKSTDWDKADWNNMLKEAPIPPSDGNKLVDAIGGKSDCNLMNYTTNQENYGVTTWTCWGEKGTAFPKIATRWSKVKLDSNIASSLAPALPSVGNTMTDNQNHQHNCHVNNHLINNKGITVSEWTCWSKEKYKFRK